MISIVMTTFNRAAQLNNTLESIMRQQHPDIEIIVVDDGCDALTPQICKHYPIQHIRLSRPHSAAYRNPCIPNNIGIRRAKGEIIILQNAECMHVDANTIERMANLVTDKNAVFAKVLALNPRGTPIMWYCSRDERPLGYFFCGAMKRDRFERMRGFDEDFTGSGFDDDDFQARLIYDRVEFVFSDILVHHQWHPPAGTMDYEPMKAVFEKKLTDMLAIRIGSVRNIGREWGVL